MLVLVSDAPQLAPSRAANTDRINLDSFSRKPRRHASDSVRVTAVWRSTYEHDQNTLDIRRFVAVERVIGGL